MKTENTSESAENRLQQVLGKLWPIHMSKRDQQRLQELKEKDDPKNKGKQLSTKRNEPEELARLEALAERIVPNRRRFIAGSVAAAIGTVAVAAGINRSNRITEEEWEQLENPDIPWIIKPTDFDSPEVSEEQIASIQANITLASQLFEERLNQEQTTGFITGSVEEVKAEALRRLDVDEANEAREERLANLLEEIQTQLVALGDRATHQVGMVQTGDGSVELNAMIHQESYTLQLGSRQIRTTNTQFVATPGTERNNASIYDGINQTIALNKIFHTYNESTGEIETSRPQGLPNEIASHLYREHIPLNETTQEGRSEVELFSDYFTTFFLSVGDSCEFLTNRLFSIQSGGTSANYDLIEKCLLIALRQSRDYANEIRNGNLAERVRARDQNATRAFLEFQENFRSAAEDYIPEVVLKASKEFI